MTAALRHASLAGRLRNSRRDAREVQLRVEALAARVTSAWERRGFREAEFPDVAAEQVRALLEHQGLRVDELAHWIFSPHHSAEHPRAPDGPIVVELYRDERMRVEATLTFQSQGEIVDHPYTGVLVLLEGLAVRSEWAFEQRERIAQGVWRGELVRRSTALLRPGFLRTSRPEDPPIEQTVVLDTACLTLCLRTNVESPRCCYRAPGLCFERRPPSLARARQLALLGRIPAKLVTFAAETCAAQVVQEGSLLDAIEVLGFMAEHGYDLALIEQVCEQGRQIHGDGLDLVWRMLEQGVYRRVLESTDVGIKPMRRLLLFLLLSMPDKASMVEFVSRELPGRDGHERLWEWLHGARAAFGLEDDGLGALLLEGLYRGWSEDGLLDRLRQEFEPQDVDALEGDIKALGYELLGKPLFRGLFSEVPWTPPPPRRGFECVLEPRVLRTLPYAARLRPLEPALVEGLVFNPRHVLQEGDRLPKELQGRVRFAEELSRRTPILWVEEPTTQHVLPYWLPEASTALYDSLRRGRLELADLPHGLVRPLYEAGIVIRPDDADGRVAAWRQTMARARESFEQHEHAILPGLVNPLWLASLRAYYRELHERGEFREESAHVRKFSIYLEGALRFLQHQLARTVGEIVSEEVVPSFCYSRIYEAGATLDRHVDRPNCVWNISIPIDLGPETERAQCWPLFVDCSGATVEIRLEMGDGGLFRGVSCEHWREPQPEGHRSTFGFALFAPASFTGTLY